MELIEMSLALFLVEFIIFIAALLILQFGIKKVGNNRLMNLEEYLPIDEIHTLRQVFYLIMITAFFINIFYSIVFWNSDLVHFSMFDCLLSLYCCLVIDKSSWKGKLLAFCLIPFGSMSYILQGNSYIGILDIIHWPAFLYLVKIYYEKFHRYTRTNGLGISILLLFLLLFISMFVTSLAENVNLLDSLIMASNAFTSNGYTILGNTLVGKIDSLFLVWGGYILSGVGTATLTAAILTRHFNNRFDELEELIKKEK